MHKRPTLPRQATERRGNNLQTFARKWLKPRPESGRDCLIGAGMGTTREKDVQGTPTQSHISPSILVSEEYLGVVGDGRRARLLLFGIRFRAKRERLKRFERLLPEKRLNPRPESGRDCLESGRDCLESGRDCLDSGRDCLDSGRDCLVGGEYLSVVGDAGRARLLLAAPPQHIQRLCLHRGTSLIRNCLLFACTGVPRS